MPLGRQYGGTGAFPEYFVPPMQSLRYIGTGVIPAQGPSYSVASDQQVTAQAIVLGVSALAIMYRAYHSIASDKKGGNTYRIYSLYPFFREKRFFNKNLTAI